MSNLGPNPYTTNGEPVGAKRPVEAEAKPKCLGTSTPLSEWRNGDYGTYINDFRSHQDYELRVCAMEISEKAAHGIIQEYGYKPNHFLNKKFICITRTENEGEQLYVCPTWEGRTFLYKHDFTWYIYNIKQIKKKEGK